MTGIMSTAMNNQHTHEDSQEQGLFTPFFPWLKQVTSTTQGLTIAVIIVFISSILMEALGAAMRNFHFHQVFFVKCPKIKLILYNVFKTFLHTAELVMMFTLMVIFMTLNAWLCASIIIGSAVGYLLFNWNSQNERESLNKPEFNMNNK